MSISLDAVTDLDEMFPAEVALPTVAVLARFRSWAPGSAAAVADVRARLAPVRGLHDQVAVERYEEDGSCWVAARFVVVSVDVHTAIGGVHQTLADAGVPVDEVWATS